MMTNPRGARAAVESAAVESAAVESASDTSASDASASARRGADGRAAGGRAGRGQRFVVASALVAACVGAIVGAPACGSGDSAPSGRPPPEPAASLTVENQPVAAVMRELSRVAGVPVVVDASATDVAECVHVSVVAAQPVPRSQLLRLVATALEPTPLVAQPSSDGWIVRRRPGVPLPEACGALALREDSLAALADFARRQRDRHDPLEGGDGVRDGDPAPGAPPSVSGRASDEIVASILAGIAQAGDDTYTLTPQARDELLADGSLLMRQARVIPHIVDGEVVGMKVFGIRRSSVLGALGLQNGDTLLSVDGLGLADPQQALDAHARVRNASEVRLRVERRGAERTLTYRVAGARSGSERAPARR